jgi:hypothetical protein
MPGSPALRIGLSEIADEPSPVLLGHAAAAIRPLSRWSLFGQKPPFTAYQI